MSGRLADRTAVVTGGASGIGLAIAQALAGEGCRVVIAGRSDEKLRAAAASWAAAPEVLSHAVDVVDRGGVKKLMDWATERLGRIDILVNNAGMNTRLRTMADMPPETWDEVLSTNATGAYNCIAAVLPQMRARRDGLIINIVSVAGVRASMLGGVAYCASKFAMHALGTAVALEEGKHGIRVTNIHPGEVDTPILIHRPQPITESHRARILQPADVAAMALAAACLPPRAHVAEMVIKPTAQDYA